MRCFYCMEEYDDEEFAICPYCGNDIGDIPSESFSLPAGSVLKERYVVGRVLGNGGFGITYIGYDESLQRKIAIKEYFPTECSARQGGTLNVEPYGGERGERYAMGLESFSAEARRLANFTAIEGVVDVYDVFNENNTAYIIMEYLSGETVKEMLNRRKSLGFGTTMNIIVPVLQSLIKVHKEGMIHRDVSPENIMRTTQGKIVLIDFGASRNNSLSVSKSLSIILKPGYAPIEQYDNKLDQAAWTDVYATAATMYKMLTGVTPDNSNSRLLSDSLKPVSELKEGLPKELDDILARALAVRPEERTQTATEFLDELLTLRDPKKTKKPQSKPQRKENTKTVYKSSSSQKKSNKPDSNEKWKTYVHEHPLESNIVSEMEFPAKTLTSDQINLDDPKFKQKIPVPTDVESIEEKSRSKVSKPLMFLTLLAFAVLGVLVVTGYIDRKNNVEVPDFLGMNVDDVVMNSDYDFDFEVANVYSPDTDLDVVVSQTPLSNSRRIPKDAKVRLTVNSINTEVTVPVLSKLSKTAAVNTLNSLYLESEIVVEQNDSIDEGSVIRTDPPNGSKVKVLSKVTIYVAENSIPAPYVVGMTYDDAAAELQNRGLQVGEIRYEYSEEYEYGYVSSQGVIKDSPLEKGSAVPLVVSLGAPYNVSINESVDLSTLKPQFRISVKCGDVTEAEKTYYTLAFSKSYSFEITRLNTEGIVPVEVYIDDELFAEYEFDFGTEKSTLIANHEVSASRKNNEPEEESDKDSDKPTVLNSEISSEEGNAQSSKVPNVPVDEPARPGDMFVGESSAESSKPTSSR